MSVSRTYYSYNAKRGTMVLLTLTFYSDYHAFTVTADELELAKLRAQGLFRIELDLTTAATVRRQKALEAWLSSGNWLGLGL